MSLESEYAQLKNVCLQCLVDVSREAGFFYASPKEEAYGRLFGRDGVLTSIAILDAYTIEGKTPRMCRLLDVARNTLLALAATQGQEVNIESNEEPGKILHEHRKNGFVRATNGFVDKGDIPSWERSWFIYPDGEIRNYDSLDATPLWLIGAYRYWQETHDDEFLLSILPHVEKALNWIITYGDRDKDFLLEYEFHKDRKYGGLRVQSWTDSHESLMRPDGMMPGGPIAPIEVQGYAWFALRLWSDFYRTSHPRFSRTLRFQADGLKHAFSRLFILKDNGYYYGAQALDGDKNQITTVTVNPLVCLWASYVREEKGQRIVECIIDDRYIPDFVRRAFLPDMFDKDAGIRTMSTLSPTFNPREDSYHNGSFWVIANYLAYKALATWGWREEADFLREASLRPPLHFGTPIEQCNRDVNGEYLKYRALSGQVGCDNQSWSAAAILVWLIEKSVGGKFSGGDRARGQYSEYALKR